MVAAQSPLQQALIPKREAEEATEVSFSQVNASVVALSASGQCPFCACAPGDAVRLRVFCLARRSSCQQYQWRA